MPSEDAATTGAAPLGLIWAQAVAGVIGDAGSIPWRLPEDLARFKELTQGGAVIMGRRTWDSLPERFRPLTGRHNIVITRQPDWSAAGATVVHSLAEALDAAVPSAVWIIGGGDIYRQSMPLADRLEVTEVDLDAAGDTVAPGVDAAFRQTDVSEWLTSRTGLRYRFVSYERVTA
ncbi:dihydrofolate reductase [Cryobacterium adonitolivorans]|uniref:Dihydrofolate reductase n=1 Tax=Cryobacterium adonitolivorans TaxID=1259189 RepID=A0A4R8WGD0_9MICO|nr:dihydrofolate reductase [Cryobacterium adonitolivorans]TFC07034.1 dihydrofolate reductase [Cryobacterium adonitolivorans]